jgi:hypothetical protein
MAKKKKRTEFVPGDVVIVLGHFSSLEPDGRTAIVQAEHVYGIPENAVVFYDVEFRDNKAREWYKFGDLKLLYSVTDPRTQIGLPRSEQGAGGPSRAPKRANKRFAGRRKTRKG